MIDIGFVYIHLDRSMSVIQKDINLFQTYTEKEQELYKLNLIKRLLDTDIIQAEFSVAHSQCILCEIRVISHHLGAEIPYFLDLLSLSCSSADSDELHPVISPVQSPTHLLDLFLHLPSPCINHDSLKWCTHSDILDFLKNDIETQVLGMKTTLYTYQKHSVWKILQRELAPVFIDPYHVVAFKDIKGAIYFLNQFTGDITDHMEKVPDAKGGVICEDMGTGKTCICLATVMLTRDLSNMVEHQNSLKTDLVRGQSIQTLKMISAVWLLKYGINWKPVKHQLPLDAFEWFKHYPVYYEWTDMPYLFERPRRVEPDVITLTVYLSHTTLVVVPDNLVAQWTGEIYKHIEDGQLSFVTFDDIKQKIIEPTTLIDYDLVLISQTRFSFENSQGGLDFTSNACQCPLAGSSEEKTCICSVSRKQTYISPLLQVHWKRIIIDEGHKLSSKNRQSELASKLFCNWKWICTGTPTQNLTESAAIRTRQESETDDLNRLGVLFGQVLHIEPFRSNRKAWKTLISKPFLQQKPWAIQRLAQLMERTMIRNQRIDIEKEVSLPPLYQKTVYLNFDYYQWLAHNCQIAMISLNAILSKREGPDYLFSPKNFKALRETVHNLWQSCLWHSVEHKLVQTAYDNCVEKYQHVQKGLEDYGEENKDLERIQQVLGHALDTNMFVCMMSQHSPPYVVQGLPNLFKENWGWLHGDHGAYIPLEDGYWNDHCVMSAHMLSEKMNMIRTAGKSDPIFVYDGFDQSLMHVQDKKTDQQQQQQLTFYTRNTFSDACVLTSSSVKINYLVDQICQYQATEKCIIFSQHANEMYEICFALELAKVRVLMYQDSRMNNTKRSQMILTFNTSDNANVMIMAVQKAAYGIDLSSATRIYFVSPVWQPAMEQQAIKRAHRIGQTKPVYVETLVIRNTIEDELLKRRNQVVRGEGLADDKENLKRGDFFTDSKLRNILNHATFVPLPDSIFMSNKRYFQPIVPLKRPLWFIPSHQSKPVVENNVKVAEYRKLKKPVIPHDFELDIEGDQEEIDNIPSYKFRISESKTRKTSPSPPPAKKKKVRFV